MLDELTFRMKQTNRSIYHNRFSLMQRLLLMRVNRAFFKWMLKALPHRRTRHRKVERSAVYDEFTMKRAAVVRTVLSILAKRKVKDRNDWEERLVHSFSEWRRRLILTQTNTFSEQAIDKTQMQALIYSMSYIIERKKFAHKNEAFLRLVSLA